MQGNTNAAMIIAKICSVLKMFLAMEIFLTKRLLRLVGRLPRINICHKNKAFYFLKGCLYRCIHDIRKWLVNAPKIKAYVIEIKSSINRPTKNDFCNL